MVAVAGDDDSTQRLAHSSGGADADMVVQRFGDSDTFPGCDKLFKGF